MIAKLLLEQIIQLFLMGVCGYAAVRIGILKSSDSKPISALIVYIICPCTITNAFQIEFSEGVIFNFSLAVVSAVIIFLLLFVFTALMNRIVRLNRIERASIIYSNAGNLIIPLVTSILGEEWVIYSSAFLLVELFLMWTHGKSLIEEKKGADLKSIFTNINLIACVIGFVLFVFHIQLPTIIKGTVKSLGSMIGPLSMLMLGMIIADADLKKIFRNKRIWLICLLKMVFTPALVILIMKYCGISSYSPQGKTLLYISLLATMTPTATTVVQMAQLYDKDVAYASAINALTTVICVITMPLMTILYYL